MMRLIKFGPKRKFPSRKELIAKYMASSTCSVKTWDGGAKGITIRFYGAMANIPSLKNQRLPGKNFTNPDVKARIAVMDLLFKQSCSSAPNYGKSDVFVAMVCANRPRSFDLIGCMETVQDWLEPSTKKVGKKARSRGWGIGLIDNDSQVTPFVCRAELFGSMEACTTIHVVPMRSCVSRLDLTPLLTQMGYLKKEAA